MFILVEIIIRSRKFCNFFILILLNSIESQCFLNEIRCAIVFFCILQLFIRLNKFALANKKSFIRERKHNAIFIFFFSQISHTKRVGSNRLRCHKHKYGKRRCFAYVKIYWYLTLASGAAGAAVVVDLDPLPPNINWNSDDFELSCLGLTVDFGSPRTPKKSFTHFGIKLASVSYLSNSTIYQRNPTKIRLVFFAKFSTDR